MKVMAGGRRERQKEEGRGQEAGGKGRRKRAEGRRQEGKPSR
jgi:hypothetical protein